MPPGDNRFRKWLLLPDSMLAGAGAGFVSSVVIIPLDVIKTKLQAQKLTSGSVGYVGAVGTVKKILLDDGVRGLYRGLGPTLLGYLPTWAIYFTIYDGFKRAFGEEEVRRRKHNAEPAIRSTWGLHVLAAMTAGATGSLVTNPLWVIRTRFMTQAKSERYRSTAQAFWTIYRKEGIRAFYQGLAPSLLGVSHVAVQFPLYEQLKQWREPIDGSPLPAHSLLLCSGVSKAVASMVTYPHEVVRTRMQVIQRPHVPKQQWKRPAWLSRIHMPRIPWPARLNWRSRSHAPTPPQPTGTSPAAVTSPPPVTPQPPSPPPLAKAPPPPLDSNYRGVISTFVTLIKNEGLRGLYKGFGINLIRTVPNSIVTLLSYELLMRSLASIHG